MSGKPEVSFFQKEKKKELSHLKPLSQHDLKRLEITGHYA